MPFLLTPLVAAIAAALLRHRYPAAAFGLWLAPLIAPLFIVKRKDSEQPFSRGELVMFSVVVMLSATFRLWAIERQPVGFSIDEATTTMNAEEVARATFDPFGWTPLQSWRPDWVRTSNLYLYYAWLCFATGGFTRFGVKLISVAPALLTPLILFRMARRIVTPPFAFLAAATLATSMWDVTISRWGWDEVLTTMLLASSYALLLRATTLFPAARTMFAAGGLCGLAQFAYASSRAGAIVAFAYVGLRLVAPWEKWRLHNAAAFIIGFATAAAPLLADTVESPSAFIRRGVEVSVFQTSAPAATLVANVAKYALMFNVRGDRRPRHNYPERAELEVLPGLLFLAGLVVAFREWRSAQSQLLLLWLVIGIIPGVATLQAPHAYRTGFVAPACFLLAALGAQRLASAAKINPAVSLLAVAAIVAVSSATTYVTYFVRRDGSQLCWRSNQNGAVAYDAANAVEPLAIDGVTILFDDTMRTPEWELERRLLIHRTGAPVSWVRSSAVTPEGLDRAVLVTVPPGDGRFPRALAALGYATVRNHFGDPIAAVIGRLDQGALRE